MFSVALGFLCGSDLFALCAASCLFVVNWYNMEGVSFELELV